MAHAQQQILDELQALLIAGATAAGSSVFVDRVDPLQPSQLPAILIDEAAGESVQQGTFDGIYQRTMQVSVDCVVTAGTAAIAQAREFALAVEVLIANSAALAAVCPSGIQLQSSRPLVGGDGEYLLASRKLVYELSYTSSRLTPNVIY